MEEIPMGEHSVIHTNKPTKNQQKISHNNTILETIFSMAGIICWRINPNLNVRRHVGPTPGNDGASPPQNERAGKLTFHSTKEQLSWQNTKYTTPKRERWVSPLCVFSEWEAGIPSTHHPQPLWSLMDFSALPSWRAIPTFPPHCLPSQKPTPCR